LLGNNKVTVQSISLLENGNETFTIKNLEFENHSDIHDGILDINKELTIKQMNISDYQLGPMHFDISFNKLSTHKVEEMLEAYDLITERGELYESQLAQKMLMMLPEVLNSGTTFFLNNFDVATQDGSFYMNGRIVWKDDNGAMPENYNDMFSSADMKIDIKVTKKLTERCIDVISTLPWFNRINQELDQLDAIANDEMVLTKKINTAGVFDLLQQKKLKDSDARYLLSLQKSNASSKDYAAAVKNLWISKSISQETSYILLYLYSQVQAPLESMKFLLQKNQHEAAKEISVQFKHWIDAGYIKEENDNYIISLKKTQKGISINEKLLSP
jgi:hypothetical protein